MKSIILVACLILSANAAPQKTAGLEQESSVKSAKLQFSPADAQVYTSALPKVATVDQINAGNVVVPQVYSGYEQIVPGYYSGAAVYPGAVQAAAVYPGQVPYYSAGRSTATTITGANGLPAGTVYEHQGATHIGHTANAVHIKRQGQWYQPSVVGSPYYAGGIVSGAAPVLSVVPAHLVPQNLYSTAYEGQIQLINGQPAQKVNGQWYYVNSAVPQVFNPQILNPQIVNPLVNQYSSVYTNTRSNVLPLAAPAGKALAQPGPQYTTSVLGYKPAVDSKWYTKTNTQQVAQPFWTQGQVQQLAAAAGTKQYAVPRPEAAEAEKADW